MRSLTLICHMFINLPQYFYKKGRFHLDYCTNFLLLHPVSDRRDKTHNEQEKNDVFFRISDQMFSYDIIRVFVNTGRPFRVVRR